VAEGREREGQTSRALERVVCTAQLTRRSLPTGRAKSRSRTFEGGPPGRWWVATRKPGRSLRPKPRKNGRTSRGGPQLLAEDVVGALGSPLIDDEPRVLFPSHAIDAFGSPLRPRHVEVRQVSVADGAVIRQRHGAIIRR
jgi:hypothetical protein